MPSEKPNVSEEKLEIIRNYNAKDIISFIDEIKGKELKDSLNFYIPVKLRYSKNDSEKYGIRTKQKFLELFTKTDGSGVGGKKNLHDELQGRATRTYIKIYLLWLESQPAIVEFGEKYEDFNVTTKESIDFLIEGCKQKKYPREIVEKYYKYSPYIDLDEDIEKKIAELDFQYVDYAKQLKKEVSEQTNKIVRMEELENINAELSKKLKIAQEETRNQNIQIEEQKERNNNLNSQLELQNEEINKVLYENKILLEENNILHKEISNIDNIANPLKMKESLQNKIKELNTIIEEKNKEIEDLKYDKLDNSSGIDVRKTIEYLELEKKFNRIVKMNMSELEKRLQVDKKLQQTILSLILNNSKASKLVIKHLNLKEEVINEGYDYYENEMLEKRIELEQLQKKVKELKQVLAQPNFIKQEEKTVELNTNKEEIFEVVEQDGLKIFNKAQNGFMRKFEISKFLIMNNDDFQQFFNLADIKKQICRVIVEPNWHSWEDWIGKYEDGVFHPAKTLVSDYYRFVKNNPELPFGLVVFQNFNKILPEIYLQSFIEAIEENGYFDLIHHSEIKDAGEFSRIEDLPKLKYIMLKSDDENSFSIPKTLEKYIV